MNRRLRDLVRLVLSARIDEGRTDAFDWSSWDAQTLNDFWRLVETNRLGGQLRRFADRSGAALPEPLRQNLSLYHRKTLFLNAMYLKTLIHLAPSLRRAGIRWFLFKGVAAQIEVHDDRFMNYTTDLDIYVSPLDYAAARRAAEASGYEVVAGGDSFWWRGFLGEQHFKFPDAALLGLDLHHRSEQPGCPRPRRSTYFLDMAEPRTIGSVEVQTLGRVSNALFTALSLAKAYLHHEPCGRYLADLETTFLTLPDTAKAELVEAARDQGLLQTLAFAAKAVEVVFGRTAGLIDVPQSRAAVLQSEDGLALSLLDPSDPSVVWPRRARILLALCDTPMQAPRAIGWKLASEGWHHLFERSRPGTVERL